MGAGFEKELQSVTTENWPDKFDYFFVSADKRTAGQLGHFATPANIKLFICEVSKKQLQFGRDVLNA